LIGTTMVPRAVVIDGAIVTGAFPEQFCAETEYTPAAANRSVISNPKIIFFIFFFFG
jgi:hypothetical protein